MARLQLGQSHCQIAGTTVPAAEFTLAPEDWIYFSHHVLLWTEPQTRLTNMPLKGAWNRKMAGLPLIMVEARGPGHLALSDNHAGNCINPINVREALINMVKEADLPDDTRKQYLEFLQDTLHKEYLEILEKEITRAFVYSYQEQAEALFQNYLDHAEAYVNKSKVKDRNTKEELAPDEGFMKSIEEQIAIIGSAADGFRQEVIAYLWAANRHGEKIDYRSYEPLKEAIEKKLITSVRDLSRVITKSRMRDEEQSEKYDAMVKNLLEHGYCPSCVDVVLKYAANNLWKD